MACYSNVGHAGLRRYVGLTTVPSGCRVPPTEGKSFFVSLMRRPESIEIPVRGQDEVVEVYLEDLPEDANEICGIIIEEAAPVELFLQFATEYYYKGNLDAYQTMIRAGLKDIENRTQGKGDLRKAEVALLSSLAAFHIARSLATGDAHQLEEAAMIINDADRREVMNESLWVRRGLLLLVQGKYQAAEYQFNAALSRDSESIPAHLGMAVGFFQMGNYANALKGFQLALRKLPSLGTDVRLAIGYCLVRLGLVGSAEQVFARLLQEDPNNDAVLVASAILDINRGAHHPGAVAKGIQTLKLAYDRDRNNPTVLTQLANHMFFKKDLTKALSLATSALSHATQPNLQAEAYYFLGKIYHAQRAYGQAFDNYSSSVRLDPNNSLAQLGLGQMALYRHDFELASGCLERAQKLAKGEAGEGTLGGSLPQKDANFLAMLALVRLAVIDSNADNANSNSGSNDNDGKISEGLIRQAIEASSGEALYDLWLALASIQEKEGAFERAVESYEMAQSLNPDGFARANELVNNYGVVLHAAGKLDQALAVLTNLIKSSSAPELSYVAQFNMAHLYEDLGRWEDAERIYRQLTQQDPNDIKVHLRLGIVASRRGQHNEAVEHFKEVIGIEDNNVDAWTLLAMNHLRLKAITPARKGFERILKQYDRHDLASLVALGNIAVEAGKGERRPEAFRDSLRRALEFFVKALQLQPRSHLAANGVGIVLAELGRYQEAKEIFLQVRQAQPHFIDSSLNLAHCFVELGQYPAAIHAYEQVLERVDRHKSSSVRLFLGRAYYLKAKEEKSLVDFENAIKELELATQQLPRDTPLQFNIALCQQEMASVLLKRGVADCNDEDAVRALQMLDSAYETFVRLGSESSTSANGGSNQFDINMAKHRAKYCQALRASLESRLAKSKAFQESRQAKLEQVKRQRETQLAEEARKSEAEREARLRDQERNEAIRRELAAKFYDMEEKIRSKAHQRDVSEDEGRSESGDDDENGNRSDDEKGEADKGKIRRTKSLKRSRERGLPDSQESKESGGKNPKESRDDPSVSKRRISKRRTAVPGSDSERETIAPRGRRPKLSADTISTSDEN